MVVKVKGHKRSGGKVKVKSHKRSSPDTGDLPFKAGDSVKKKSAGKKKDSSLKGMAKKKVLSDETYRDVKIKFFYDDDLVVAQPYGFSFYQKAGNKDDAFVDIKRRIDYEMDNGVMTSLNPKYNFPAEFKRSVSFVDKEGKNVKLDISYDRTVPSQDPDFSISGSRAGSSGQVTFVPKNQPQTELNELWKKYHLKSDVPKDIEKWVDDLISRIEDAEDSEQDDLDLDGWKLTAMKELAEMEDEVFTDASEDSDFGQDFLTLNGAGDYMVFESYDDAEAYAVARVAEDLENEPELFTQDWLNNYLTVSETDKNMIADEDAQSYVDDIRDEDDGRRVCEEANRESDYDEIVEQIEEKEEKVSDMEDAGQDEVLIQETRDKITSLESDKESLIDECAEELSEKMADDTRDRIENDLMDWLSDFGYDMSNLPSFVSIDVGEASQDAVDTDGVAHFLAGYDGNEIELPSGAVAYRVN